MLRRFAPAPVVVPHAQSLPGFVQPLVEAAEAGEDLRSAVLAVIGGMGFDSMMYGGNTIPVDKPSADGALYAFTTSSDEWVRHYAKQKYYEVDPRITRTWNTTLPLLWDQTSERGRSLAEDAFLDDAVNWGVGSGIALSYRTALNLRVVIGLSESATCITSARRDAIMQRLGDIYLFFTTFHGIFVQAIVECRNSLPQEGAPMSEIEWAALRLVGQGVPLATIADNLALDPEEVERYLHNACTKLGVEAPAVAAARARERGMLGV